MLLLLWRSFSNSVLLFDIFHTLYWLDGHFARDAAVLNTSSLQIEMENTNTTIEYEFHELCKDGLFSLPHEMLVQHFVGLPQQLARTHFVRLVCRETIMYLSQYPAKEHSTCPSNSFK